MDMNLRMAFIKLSTKNIKIFLKMRIGLIGDPHFNVKNVKEMTEFVDKIMEWLETTNPDILVVLGDILHTHATIYIKPLMMAIEFLTKCSKKCLTYLLIGNHDRPNNNNFLTHEHPFNGIKIDNLTIVDIGLLETLVVDEDTFKLAMVPYVPPGRFMEAYKKIVGDVTPDLVFAHQEFRGCDLGNSKSLDGDRWSRKNPPVISGHIHIKQTLKNIHYVGTPMQHEFGDETDKGVHIVELTKEGLGPLEHFPLEICLKITKKIKINKLHNFKPDPNVSTRLIIEGTSEEIAAVRQTSRIKDLEKAGCKVLYKVKGNKKVQIKKINRRFLDVVYDILTPEELEIAKKVFCR